MSEEKNNKISLGSMRQKRQDKNKPKSSPVIDENKDQAPVPADVKPKISLSKKVESETEPIAAEEDIIEENKDAPDLPSELLEAEKNSEEIATESLITKEEENKTPDSVTEITEESAEEDVSVQNIIPEEVIENSIPNIEEKTETTLKALDTKESKKKDGPNKEEVIFSNYSSDFSGKEKGIMAKIKKIKDIPKTRPKLVGGLMLTTAISLSIIFYLFPSIHSVNNYKASLLGSEREITEEEKQAPKDNLNNKLWEKEIITHGGNKIEVEFQLNSSTGTKTYRYNNEQYTSIDDIKEVLVNNKVKKYLLKTKKDTIKPVDQIQVKIEEDTIKLEEQAVIKTEEENKKSSINLLQKRQK